MAKHSCTHSTKHAVKNVIGTVKAYASKKSRLKLCWTELMRCYVLDTLLKLDETDYRTIFNNLLQTEQLMQLLFSLSHTLTHSYSLYLSKGDDPGHPWS
jgi:hypothetical protein